MKFIKIKVKTLILLVMIIGIGLIFGKNLYWRGLEFYNDIMPEEMEIDIFTMQTSRLEDEANRLSLLMKSHPYQLYNLVTIGDGSMMSSARIRALDGEKILMSYRRFEERYDDLSHDYQLNVLLSQWFSGNRETTQQLIEEIEKLPLEAIDQNHFYLIKAAVDLSYFRLGKVEADLTYITLPQYQRTVEEIKEFMNKAYDYDIQYKLDRSELVLDEEALYNGFYQNISFYNDSYDFEELIGSKKKGTYVSGKVSLDGEPLAGVFVYPKNWSGISSNEGIGPMTAVTDEMGHYEIDCPYDDLKRVNLIAPWQLIHDKQIERPYDMAIEDGHVENFEFTAGLKLTTLYLDGDDLVYEINDPLGDSTSRYLMSITYYDLDVYNSYSYIELTGVSGRISLESIRKNADFAYGRVSSDTPLNYLRLMEHLYLSEDYVFEVRQLKDIPGRYISNGLFQEGLSKVLYVPGNSLSDGDLLLKEGRLEEAMAWFDEQPSRHGLKVLIALYGYGYIHEEDDFRLEVGGRDLQKALKYLEDLMVIDGETNDRWEQYWYFANEAYEYEKAYNALMKMEETQYVAKNIGFNFIRRGAYEKGRNYWLTHTNVEEEADDYAGIFLLGGYTDELPEKIVKAYEAVDKKNYIEPFETLIRQGAYQEAWQYLSNLEDEDLKICYELLFLDDLQSKQMNLDIYKKQHQLDENMDFMTFYMGQVEKIKDKNIAELLKTLKEGHRWY